MEKSINGKRFGKLTAIKRVRSPLRAVYYLCRCDCGATSVVKKQNLQLGNTKSCGCLHFRKASEHKDWKGYGEISGDFVGTIRRNAKARGIKFDLSTKFLWELFVKQDRRCAYSNVELVFPTSGKSRDGTASLDRKDNTKNYSKNNVQWVHKDVNLMKRTMTEEVFLDFCKRIVENAGR